MPSIRSRRKKGKCSIDLSSNKSGNTSSSKKLDEVALTKEEFVSRMNRKIDLILFDRHLKWKLESPKLTNLETQAYLLFSHGVHIDDEQEIEEITNQLNNGNTNVLYAEHSE
jgi:hypothetical protein